ncbi:MAG: hypothetical protein M3281_08165, partial [Chloroflexota bacterium]|nr:hypothetical protein [Chloroflexota bacterium]
PVVTELLNMAPGLRVLATSRVLMHLYGEHEYRVLPLSLPSPTNLVEQSEAVRLFVQAARSARPDFELTAANSGAVAAICERLDGLPLAIELAAARIRLFSPEALLERLANRLEVLGGRSRDLPVRQHTLRQTFDWSYDLLAPAERGLLAALGVFAGGFTPEAAEAVRSDDQPGVALRGLEVLHESGLVERVDHPSEELRFRLLETVRAYALARLAESCDGDSARQRHAEYYLALAERAEPELLGPRPESWLAHLAADHANLMAAISWFDDTEDAEAEARLAGALREYWYATGRWTEGRTRLEHSVARSSELSTPVAAKVLVAAGFLAHYQGDDGRAVPLLEHALELLGRTGNEREEAYAQYLLGVVAEDRGDYATSTALLSQAARRMRELGDGTNAAYSESHLGIVALGRGDLAAAARHGEAAHTLAIEGGSRDATAVATLLLGDTAREGGDLATAAAWYRDYLAIVVEDGPSASEDLARAAASVAVLAVRRRELERAAHLLGAAERLRNSIGLALAQPELAASEQAMAQTGRALGAHAFETALDAGRAMEVREVIVELEKVLMLSHP